MNILLVNDDGIEAAGLWALARRLLADGHRVVVVAPARQMSGSSHAVTLHGALSYMPVEGKPCESYQLTGTPCDCVKFGLLVLTRGMDCVISGINDTMNVGTDVLYSGTVNAALEGAIEGVASLAVSCDAVAEDFTYAADFVADNLAALLALCEEDVALSVNIPYSDRSRLNGICVAPCGVRKFDDYYTLLEDGYHIGGTPRDALTTCDDLSMVADGYICLTPIRAVLSDEALVRDWRAKVKDLCW